ncbi:MAG: TonB family protein [Candidatus Sphingomonas colombiensis]|nr:TonB family protein [Sphingomonas sp.]WEK44209.1 MAG: TonB family protein [Sphingomonas sp.]
MFAALMFFALQATQDLAATEAVQPPRIRNLKNAASNAHYPSESIQRREYGIVSVLLHVSSDGSVESCLVTEKTNFAALDNATCSLFKQTRFYPARNAAGLAVAGDYRGATAWGTGDNRPKITIELPLQVYDVPKDYKSPVKGRILIDASGHVAACDIVESSGSGAADRAACAYIEKHGFVFSPFPKSGASDVSPIAVRPFIASLSKQPSEESNK